MPAFARPAILDDRLRLFNGFRLSPE